MQQRSPNHRPFKINWSFAQRTLCDLMIGLALFVGMAGLLMFDTGGLAQAANADALAEKAMTVLRRPAVDFVVLCAMFSVLFAFNMAVIRHMSRQFAWRRHGRP